MDDIKEDSWHIITAENVNIFGDASTRNGTTEHALEVAHVYYPNRNEDGRLDVDTSVDLTAICRWDGCVHLYVGCRINDDPDYVHVCDLDAFIGNLQRIRDMAREHFAGRPEWEVK